MNSTTEINVRLVKLFPAKLIRDHFEIEEKGVVDGLENIQAIRTSAAVNDFVLNNIWMAKQHVYIYEGDQNIPHKIFNRTEWPEDPIYEGVENGWNVWVFLPSVSYTAYLKEPFKEEEIKCIQPIMVRIKGRYLAVHAVILERNAANFLSDEKKNQLLKAEKDWEESELISQFADSIYSNFEVEICDITKGVKQLMINDVTDCQLVKYRKDRSICTENMDEEHTLKSSYPDVYEDMLRRPLKNTIFKYIIEDDNMAKRFTSDPEEGKLSFNLFPKNENQIRNVIDEILRHN